jgi:hypothetical protein
MVASGGAKEPLSCPKVAFATAHPSPLLPTILVAGNLYICKKDFIESCLQSHIYQGSNFNAWSIHWDQ